MIWRNKRKQRIENLRLVDLERELICRLRVGLAYGLGLGPWQYQPSNVWRASRVQSQEYSLKTSGGGFKTN